MDNMVYTNVVPRLRVMETRILDDGKLNRIIDSASPEDAVKILQETEYAAHMSGMKRAEDYEVILSGELRRVYRLMYEICPVKSVVDVMSVKYDYHNIKVLIKSRILDRDFSNLLIPIGMIELEKLQLSIKNDNHSDLPFFMRDAIEKIQDDFAKYKDPQRVDIIADRYMFQHMLSISMETGDDFIEKYVKTIIDFTNLKALLRIKKQKKSREFLNDVIVEGGYIDCDKIESLLLESAENIPVRLNYTDYAELLKAGIEAYVKNGSVNFIEKLMDNYLVAMIRDTKYVSFSPEPVIAYIYAKENEIKLLRIILVGKINKISPELIRERLRDNYV